VEMQLIDILLVFDVFCTDLRTVLLYDVAITANLL